MIKMSAQTLFPIQSHYSREEFFDEIQDFESLTLPNKIINLKKKIPIEGILKPAVKSSQFFKLVKPLALPFKAFSNISLLSLPPHMDTLFRPLVQEIHRREHLRKKKSSRCDCYLGFLARVYGMEVISYDKDVYNSLSKILQFQACWPLDVVDFNRSGAFLVDTNVLIYLKNQDQTHFSKIMELFEKEGIELIIPDIVLAEYWNCMKREGNSKNKKKSGKKSRRNPKKKS
ncbi:MAG: type II toxin-antitoxin system VapC family toxin [Promethearchaeota archaeon]